MNNKYAYLLVALVAVAFPSIAFAQMAAIVSSGSIIIRDAQVIAYLVAGVSLIVALAKYGYTRESHDAKGAGIVCACALGVGLSITILNAIIGATSSGNSAQLSLPSTSN